MKPLSIQSLWYDNHLLAHCLRPISWLYKSVIYLRKTCYRLGVFNVVQFDYPLIVVGNITVGGSGKTPLVLYLAELLTQQGYKPGIVSRGYGGKAERYPMFVTGDSDPQQAGDEPVLIAKRSQCPVVVDPKRVNAVKKLLANTDCNIIISDDGLQHYAMGRDIEIAVIDAERYLGNGLCLPAGPLRESRRRLHSTDMIVSNGKHPDAEYTMHLHADLIVNCLNSELTAEVNDFSGQQFHALAGIGNPQRFFTTLQQMGVQFQAHVFADHYPYTAKDLVFNDSRPIIMTEKDSVKCQGFATANMWYLPITARLGQRFDQQLLSLLQERELLTN